MQIRLYRDGTACRGPHILIPLGAAGVDLCQGPRRRQQVCFTL